MSNATTAASQVSDTLTPEQQALIPVYLKRFLEIGTCTRPTDRQKAEDAIRRSYVYLADKKLGNFSKNPEIVWAESPMQGAKLAAQFNKGNEDVTEAEIRAQAQNASFGSFEAHWVAVYAFIAEQLPVEKDELIDITLDIIAECGVYWTFEDLVVLTPKPSEIYFKDEKLHNEVGPALAYANGDGLYAIEGELKKSLMDITLSSNK